MSSYKIRPERRELKAINLYETKFHLVEGEDVIQSTEPRWVSVHAHMTKEEAMQTLASLQELIKKHIGGTIIVGFTGRMV